MDIGVSKADKYFMSRALELAARGKGFVSPNPLVGAVIVKNDTIIGEGWHKIYGGLHAEINALNNTTENPQEATIYSTLEPCSHFGKTPPCSLVLIENKFRRIVIAHKDPNPLVAGKGIAMLKEKGIEVVCGVLEEKASLLNEVFIKYITTKRPFVVMKTAMTLDGKIATHTGDSKWISNETSRRYVHKLRHAYKAIMVGVETVIKDNPELNCRLKDSNVSQPIRVVVDSKLRIPENAKVLDTEKAPTCIATISTADKTKMERLKNKGVEIIITKEQNGSVHLGSLMKKLGEKTIDSILLEGGGTLNYSALNAEIVDKVVSFVSPKILGGTKAKSPVEGKGVARLEDAHKLRNLSCQKIENDLMITSYIKK